MKSEQTASKAATTIAQLEYDELSEKIDLQVSQCRFKVKEAQKKYAMTLKNIASAEENLRCANLGFSEGVISSTDVMAAQTAWQQALEQKIEAETRSEQIRILKESQELKTKMVEEAKQQARAEAAKIVEDARVQIAKEQQEAMEQVKNEVITLSVSIAEKILQRELSKDTAQDKYVEQLLNNHNQAEA